MKLKKIHYGFGICIGCILALIICCGLALNAFSVTIPFVLKQNAFTNTQTSMITTMRAVGYFVSTLFFAKYYQSLGYRLGLTVSTLMTSAAYLTFMLAGSNLLAYYLGGFLTGVSNGLGSIVAVTILINRWFLEKRSTALGVCAASTGLATVVFSPLMTRLIETLSLQICFRAVALFSTVVAVLVFLILRDDPYKIGKLPYGQKEEVKTQEAGGPGVRFSTLHWWVMLLAVALFGACATPSVSHQTVLLTTEGFSPMTAARAYSISGAALMLGKIAFGALSDRVGRMRSTIVFCAILLVSLTMFLFLGSGSVPLAFASFALFGVGLTVYTVGISIWTQDFASDANRKQMLYRFQLAYAVGRLAFSTVPGIVADRTGSYIPAYAIFLGMSVFASAVVMFTYQKVPKQ